MIETRFTYQDDFSDPASGWLTYDGDQGKMMYHSGSYQVLVDIPNWIMISQPDHEAVDTILQVEAYKSGGPDDNIFGAICRYLDDNNFYFLGISSDGYYGIGKLINGEMTLINQDNLYYSDFINQGRTSNLLQANCIGSKLALYANGTLLAEGQDSALTQGGVGLMAGSFNQYGVNILFDNFKMTDLAKP